MDFQEKKGFHVLLLFSPHSIKVEESAEEFQRSNGKSIHPTHSLITS